MTQHELVLRAGGLHVPVIATAGLVLRTLDRNGPRRAVAVQSSPGRRLTAAFLATAWNVPALLAVNAVAQHAGWWRFAPTDATVAGMPVDLWLGWALLWGAVPVLATADRWLLAIVSLVALDLAVMPLLNPVVRLEDPWLVGEALAVAVALLPSFLLARWTTHDRHVLARAGLQAAAFAGLALYVVPSLVFAVTGETWAVLLDRPTWQFVVAALVAAPAALASLAAVLVFARDGGGTPFPLDPPRRLVTTGPYRYVANPMQLGGTVVLAVWGTLLASPAVVGGAAMAALFSAGMATWIEDNELIRRFGPAWQTYRETVHLWLPRPPPADGPASSSRPDASSPPVDLARNSARRRAYSAAHERGWS